MLSSFGATITIQSSTIFQLKVKPASRIFLSLGVSKVWSWWHDRHR